MSLTHTIKKTKLPWLTRPGNRVAYSIQAPGPHVQANSFAHFLSPARGRRRHRRAYAIAFSTHMGQCSVQLVMLSKQFSQFTNK